MPLNVPLVTQDTVVQFLLVLTRVGGLLLTAPLLSQSRLPPHVKGALAVVVAAALLPVVRLPEASGASVSTLAGWILGEAAAGALIGLLAAMIFAGIATGGQMIGFQMGLTYAGAVDPQFNSQMSPVAEIMNLAGLLLFLLMDGHHHLLRALALSYRLAPAGAFHLAGHGVERLVAASGGLFVLALQIAAPVIILLLLTDAALSLLSRLVPQMNIFVVGAPAKIAAGLVMLALSMPLFSRRSFRISTGSSSCCWPEDEVACGLLLTGQVLPISRRMVVPGGD
jgi:flagellar biosynthetic protein FliR